MGFKKSIAVFLCLLLCLTAFPLAVFAENGPYDGHFEEWYPAFLRLVELDEKGEPVMVVEDGWESVKTLPILANNKVQPQDGAVYDRETNTLTLTDFNTGNYILSANMMGDDFTILIKGDCRLARMEIWGDGWGGSLRIAGDGTLTVNADKLFKSGLIFYPEGVETLRFAVEPSVKLNLSGEETAFEVYGCEADFQAVVGDTALPVEKTAAVREQYVFLSGYGNPGESFIHRADCASDPDGIYSMSAFYSDESMTELSHIEVTRYVYLPAWDLWLVDFDWPGGDSPNGTMKFKTAEEAEAAGYTLRLDANGEEIWETINTMGNYGTAFQVSADAAGNRYVVEYGYDDEHNFGQFAETIHPLEELPGKNLFFFAPGVDPESLTEVTEIVTYEDMFDYSFGETDFVLSIQPAFKPGDVDGNGEIEVTDARYALRAAVGLENYEPGMREFHAADTDENGEIEVSDARNILRAAVGLDTPADWKTA